MTKFVVICGPVLIEHDSQILDLLDEAREELNVPVENIRSVIIPESFHGGPEVREIVQNIIFDDTPTVFVTRYEHVVSELACSVSDGRISRADVMFWLVNYEDRDIRKFTLTKHRMSEDNQYIGDKWPIGVLW